MPDLVAAADVPPRRSRGELFALLERQGYDLEKLARYGGGPDAPIRAVYQVDGVWYRRDEDTGEILATGPSMKAVLPEADIIEIPVGPEGEEATIASYLVSRQDERQDDS